MNAPTTLGFVEEARELSDNEHFELTRRFEEIAAEYGEHEARRVLADYNYREDAADYFEANRQHFLERAREEFAEVAA